LIWIVGEYAEKITNAGDILSGFVESFNEEFTQVCNRLRWAVAEYLTYADSASDSNGCRKALP
jgi:hypothetical protein